MSIAKRLFEDPANQYKVDNNDPKAFDKRYVGTPGIHYEQRCCGDRDPFWDSYRIDTEDGDTSGQRRYLQSDPQGLPPGGNPYPITSASPLQKGDLLIEGPRSEYKPSWVTPDSWYADWQGLHWVESTKLANGLPSPAHWVKGSGPVKMRWGSYGGWEFLWCNKCETGLEKTWSDTLKVLPMAARGIAMIVSYIPVYGTAISFCINVTVTLAQGGSIDQAVLDGIGGALPGQPESGMAFNAAVAIARGERADQVLIAALPVDKSVKDVITAADDIIYGVATGQTFDDISYTVVLNQFSDSPDVQKAMSYAYRIAHGENIPEMILTEAEARALEIAKAEAQSYIDAAQAKGEQALGYAREKAESRLKQYAMETGYQVALMNLPIEMRDAVTTGIVVGVYQQQSGFIGTFGSVAETNVSANDALYNAGYTLVYGAKPAANTRANLTPPNRAKYKNQYIADLINDGQTFSIIVDGWDALNNVARKEQRNDVVTPQWRRGFLIAMGLCEGMSEHGPGQLAVYQSMAEDGGRSGFDAGQAVQYWRSTLGGTVSQSISLDNTGASALIMSIKPPATSMTVVQSMDTSAFAFGPKVTPTQSLGIPTLFQPPPVTPLPLTLDPSILAQKQVDRARWVEYYNKLM